MENKNEIREMIDRIKNFGTIHVNIEGNAYPRDMIVRDIKLILEKYISDNHLFVNGTEVELKPNPHKH
jgi:hypothetical protein